MRTHQLQSPCELRPTRDPAGTRTGPGGSSPAEVTRRTTGICFLITAEQASRHGGGRWLWDLWRGEL